MMRVAAYARVSTARQAQSQTIEQQLERFRYYLAEHELTIDEQHVYRDDGHSGAKLNRPGLDALRDRAALAELDLVLVTAPDRLARKYVHQVLIIEELEKHGCQIEFLDRPMSDDPHDQLLLQIRGAVAEYERTLITDRMRRGRQAKLRAGQLLPWSRCPYGYRSDPLRPRDPAGVRLDDYEASVAREMFERYLEPKATLCQVVIWLDRTGVPTPRGSACWNVASLRGILKNPVYAGSACANRTRAVRATERQSALSPVGPGQSYRLRPPEDWISIDVPAIVTREVFDRVQEKLSHNQRFSRRNNTRHEYLLRNLVSCGRCRLSTTARNLNGKYRYYECRGRRDRARAARDERCAARSIPAEQLDRIVWQDLCAVLTDSALIAVALERARGGQWLPQELQARQGKLRAALAGLEAQHQRLLEAYLAGVIELEATR